MQGIDELVKMLPPEPRRAAQRLQALLQLEAVSGRLIKISVRLYVDVTLNNSITKMHSRYSVDEHALL